MNTAKQIDNMIRNLDCRMRVSCIMETEAMRNDGREDRVLTLTAISFSGLGGLYAYIWIDGRMFVSRPISTLSLPTPSVHAEESWLEGVMLLISREIEADRVVDLDMILGCSDFRLDT